MPQPASAVCATYLTSADLTGVISWIETVPWAVHSALKYTVYLNTFIKDYEMTC